MEQVEEKIKLLKIFKKYLEKKDALTKEMNGYLR